jgi:hypothetical protein
MSAQKLEVSLGGSAPRPAASHAACQRSSWSFALANFHHSSVTDLLEASNV